MKKSLITTFVLLLLVAKLYGQSLDTTGILSVNRLNISVNNIDGTINTPSFERFARDFRLGNNFLASTGAPYEVLPISNTYTYSGFQIQFEFASNIFKDSLEKVRNKFSFGFESGSTRADLFLVEVEGSRHHQIRIQVKLFSADFRIQTIPHQEKQEAPLLYGCRIDP